MSPWVVPSSDSRTFPSTKRFEASLYVLIKIGAKDEQTCRVLCCRFRELKALLASTSKCYHSENRSSLHGWLLPTCQAPTASCRSSLVMERIALARIILTFSQTPIGLTPGDLSSAIRRQTSRAERPLGSTNVEQRHLANKANE